MSKSVKQRQRNDVLKLMFLPGVCVLAFGVTFAWKAQYQQQQQPQQQSDQNTLRPLAKSPTISEITTTPEVALQPAEEELLVPEAISQGTVDEPIPVADASPYGEFTSDELHEIRPEVFSAIESYNATDIQDQFRNDAAFNDVVMAMVREELAKPTHEIGTSLVGVASEEVTHARHIIDVVLELEEQGVLVDLDELSYARLGDDLSAGIFGKEKKIDRVVSQTDDFGNEHLSMSVLPDEKINSASFGLNSPVSVSFGLAVVSSSTNPYWSGGKNGKVIGYYMKHRDTADDDRDKDYYSYSRWSLAKPNKVDLRFATDRYSYVRTADLKSGITNGSKWKVFARVDQDPWSEKDAGSANCSSASVGVSLGVASFSTSGEWCDVIKPKWVWGGLHTRYEAKYHWFHGYGSHAGDQIRNNFAVSMSVKPGTQPYWWDYNDAYFCDPTHRSFDCAEYTQNQ